jgi:hypothetical protein
MMMKESKMTDNVPTDFLYWQEDNFGKEDGATLRFVSASPPKGTAKLISKYVRADYHADEIMSAYKNGHEDGYQSGYSVGADIEDNADIEDKKYPYYD